MNNKCIAIIPARGGSKRIPHKNIKPFLGKPIIQYSIEAAFESNLFDEVMVSTDDNEIADISKKLGAKVPFIRNETTANDHAGLADVIEEVLTNYKKEGKNFDIFCCMLATAPFITIEKLKEGFDYLNNKNFFSVFSILPYSYPIQRALKIENEKVSMINPENYNKRSQDLITTYHDCGQFYWMKTDKFLEEKKLFTNNSGAIIFSEMESHDIDTEEDWDIAEMKYKIINKINLNC